MKENEIIKNQMLVYLMMRLWEFHEWTAYRDELYWIVLPGDKYFGFTEKEMKVLKGIFGICLPACAEILEDYKRLTYKS